MITHDDARRLALALLGAYEQASHGDRPSWRLQASRGLVKEWEARQP